MKRLAAGVRVEVNKGARPGRPRKQATVAEGWAAKAVKILALLTPATVVKPKVEPQESREATRARNPKPARPGVISRPIEPLSLVTPVAAKAV